jgi:hypothetical protein
VAAEPFRYRPLPRALVIPDVMNLVTLADVRAREDSNRRVLPNDIYGADDSFSDLH